MPGFADATQTIYLPFVTSSFYGTPPLDEKSSVIFGNLYTNAKM